MKRMGALLGTLALFSSCKASVVDTHPAVKGPVPEVPYIDFGGGQVRYPLGGARSLLGVRRRDAFRRMARFCGGAAHVKVRREFDRDDSETPYNAGELEEVVALQAEHYRVHSYRHIEFQCTQPAPPPKKRRVMNSAPSAPSAPSAATSAAPAAPSAASAAPNSAVSVSTVVVESSSTAVVPGSSP